MRIVVKSDLDRWEDRLAVVMLGSKETGEQRVEFVAALQALAGDLVEAAVD